MRTQHDSASKLVHRVKESLTTRVSKIICAGILCFLLFVGIIFFILWISLRPHRPRFHIHGFAVSNSTPPSFNFVVSTRNPNEHVGIYYDSMRGSVFYKGRRVGSTPLVDSFYQDPKNTTYLDGELRGPSVEAKNDRWIQFMKDWSRRTVAIRLEILSVVSFKVLTWKTKHHRMHANCYLQMGPRGMILPRSKDQKCPLFFV